MLGQLTTFETEFKRQLDEQIAMLKAVNSASKLTMFRRGLADWYSRAVPLYLKDSTRYDSILKEFQALVPNMNTWYDQLGWSKCKEKALPIMGLIAGILSVPATAVEIKEVEKIVTQIKTEEKIVNVPVVKTNWKTVGLIGGGLAALAFVFAKFTGKKR